MILTIIPARFVAMCPSAPADVSWQSSEKDGTLRKGEWLPFPVCNAESRRQPEIDGNGKRSRSGQASRRKRRRRKVGRRRVLERGAQVIPRPHPRLLRPRRAPALRVTRYSNRCTDELGSLLRSNRCKKAGRHSWLLCIYAAVEVKA
jgi:hypothetical protein